jgi:hypothetical protein
MARFTLALGRVRWQSAETSWVTESAESRRSTQVSMQLGGLWRQGCRGMSRAPQP